MARPGMALGELGSPLFVLGERKQGRGQHLCSRAVSISPFRPTLGHPEMAMDGAFKAQLVSFFGPDTKFEAWLNNIRIQTAEDFALTTSEERLVDEEISKPAKADGVPMEIKDRVNVHPPAPTSSCRPLPHAGNFRSDAPGHGPPHAGLTKKVGVERSSRSRLGVIVHISSSRPIH